MITEAHQALATTDTSQNEIVERDNVFLGSQLVAQGIWSGSTWTTLGYNFYASDHLGTPRLVTDINASQVALRKYWPYGDDGPNTGGDGGQRLKLSGMERDSSDGKNYYDHARVESFNIGRFLSKDPLRGDPEYPQSWNRYSYVLGSPINFIDPTGLMFWPIGFPGDLYCGVTPCTSVVVTAPAPPPWPSEPTGNNGGAAGPVAQALTTLKNKLTNNVVYKSFADPNGCDNLMMRTISHDMFPYPTEDLSYNDAIAPTASLVNGGAFNLALSHAAERGLTYPFKSSIFRSFIGVAEGAEAAVLPVTFGYAVAHGMYRAGRAGFVTGECD